MTPVGGGGLIAGCATVAKTLHPAIRVAGVEPATGNDTAQSLAAGKRVNVGVPRTIADGLQAAEPGELTFDVNRELVDEVVTVSDAEIVEAMAFLFDRMKLVVEPSGAVGDRGPPERAPARQRGRRRDLGRERRRAALRRASRRRLATPRSRRRAPR